MDPVGGVRPDLNVDSMRILREYFKRKLQTVQPPEPGHQPTAEYRGRSPPERLSPETIPKPPRDVQQRVISYPDLLQQGPDGLRRLLSDDAVVVRVHPEQAKQLQGLIDEFGTDAVRRKVFIDPQAGRTIDTAR